MSHFFDAFISYGRKDSKAFATKLHARLKEQGLNVWYDHFDIPPAVDWQKQIDVGIEKAHNFLFIIAPHSVQSPYCRKEIELAVQYNKRIIPILHINSDHFWESMHPTIQKINWLPFLEDINNFDDAFVKLIEAIEKQTAYVEQHTNLLIKALEWSRHQKQTKYLLIGKEREQAEAWLKYKFETEQPPCLPTDLHSEFISESTINANNSMVEVFLISSEIDNEIKEQMRKALRREGITVWNDRRKITTETDFEGKIKKRIEGADNFIYLLSSVSLESNYCKQALYYALTLNKRIILVQLQPFDLQKLPSEFKNLPIENLLYKLTEEGEQQFNIDNLLPLIHQDAAYYQDHKILLTKALRWEQFNCLPSLLLRGKNLEHALAWLKIARQRSQQQPTPLQEAFILASSQQPRSHFQDVFMAYALADADFARRVNEALQLQGKTTWFEQEILVDQAERNSLQPEIYRGIDSSDTFVLIISPHSATSINCQAEVEYALKRNKRIVTLLYQAVPLNTSFELLTQPENQINFDSTQQDFYSSFKQLLGSLDSDREHLQSHTRLLTQAIEWDEQKRKDSLLMRGEALEAAESWLAKGIGKDPKPTQLQQVYLTSSRLAETARHRSAMRQLQLFLGTVICLFVAASILGFMANLQRNRAITAQVQALSALAKTQLLVKEPLEATLAGIKAVQTVQANSIIPSSVRWSAIAALQQSLYQGQERNRLEGHNRNISSISVSPNGKQIVSSGWDGKLNLWQADGKLLWTRTEDEAINHVKFSPDGQQILSARPYTLTLWDLEGRDLGNWSFPNAITAIDWQPNVGIVVADEQGTIQLLSNTGEVKKSWQGHSGNITSLRFSPNAQVLASANVEGTLKLWQLPQGKLTATLAGHQQEVTSLDFSPDSQMLASGDIRGKIQLWQVKTGEKDQELTLDPQSGGVTSLQWSPNSSILAAASDRDSKIFLWQVKTRNFASLLAMLEGHALSVRSLAFLPDGKTLVSGSEDRSLRFWQVKPPLASWHADFVASVSFSPDGVLLASGGGQGTLKLWRTADLTATLDSSPSTIRPMWQAVGTPDETLRAIAFSPDSRLLAAASQGTFNTLKLWQVSNGKLLAHLKNLPYRLTSLEFSPNRQLLAAVGDEAEDGKINLWQVKEGKLVKQTPIKAHEDGINFVRFSHDGQLLVTGSWDGTLKLWRSEDGSWVKTLRAHQGGVIGGRFSRDGRFFASVGADNSVKRWRTSDWQSQRIGSYDRILKDVDFSADAQVLVSSSSDDTLQLWSLDNAELIQVLAGHYAPINAIDFHPNQPLIASGAEDGNLLIWQFAPDKLLEYSCQRLQDYLMTNPNLSASDRQLCPTRPFKP